MSARQIANTFKANMDTYPRRFRRELIAEKLRFRHPREYALLSDALWVLKNEGLISWDPDAKQWTNLTRE